MIPTNEAHPNAQYISDIERTLREWDLPVLVMFSDKDIGFPSRRVGASPTWSPTVDSR